MTDTEQNFNDTGEPTTIIPDTAMKWGSAQRQGQRENSDRQAWLNDLEQRKERAVKKLETNKIEPKTFDVSQVDDALNALELAAQDFEGPNGFGKPNLPLIQERETRDRLKTELADSEARLVELEAKGDSVQRLSTAVAFAEAQLQGLLGTAETEAIKALAQAHYGWDIPLGKVSSDMRKEFALHVSVVSLRQFALPRHHGISTDVAALKERLQAVGTRLVELRDHLTEAA
jgi:hypothetical protein